jgi:hypothetical protein
MYFSLWKFSVIRMEVTHKPHGSLTNITKKSHKSHAEVTQTSCCLFDFVTGMKRRKTTPEVIIHTQLIGWSVGRLVRWSVCWLVRWSIRLSVRPSVCPSVRLSVRPSVHLSVVPSVGLLVR